MNKSPERPLYSIFIVSPSTTFKTRYGLSPENRTCIESGTKQMSGSVMQVNA